MVQLKLTVACLPTESVTVRNTGNTCPVNGTGFFNPTVVGVPVMLAWLLDVARASPGGRVPFGSDQV